MQKNILIFDLTSPYQNDELPTEFRLFQFGVNKAYKLGDGDKEIAFCQDDAERLIAAYTEAGVDLLIDYEHQSLDGLTGSKPAAGWIKSLETREDGLYATGVTWTPKAVEMLKSKEYRYFSPAVEYDDEGNMIRMLPSALTNLPALKGIKALMNSLINIEKDKPMANETKIETLDATEALSQVSQLKLEVEKLRKEKVEMEVNALLDKAVVEGRLAPAKRQEFFSQVETIGVNGLKFMLGQLPVITKASAQEPGNVAKIEELSDEEKKIAAMIGVSYEAFSAHKKVTAQRLATCKAVANETDIRKFPVLDNTKAKELVSTMSLIKIQKA